MLTLHQSLGKALLEEKKFVDAQKEFLEAVKLKPDLGTAYGDLAFAAGENKDYPPGDQSFGHAGEIPAGGADHLLPAGVGLRPSPGLQASGGELSPLPQHGAREVS